MNWAMVKVARRAVPPFGAPGAGPCSGFTSARLPLAEPSLTIARCGRSRNGVARRARQSASAALAFIRRPEAFQTSGAPMGAVAGNLAVPLSCRLVSVAQYGPATVAPHPVPGKGPDVIARSALVNADAWLECALAAQRADDALAPPAARRSTATGAQARTSRSPPSPASQERRTPATSALSA